jgi:toxin ParE1/3/4
MSPRGSGSMHVELSVDAESDLDGVFNYLHGQNPAAATRVLDAIISAAMHLESFPLLGKEGRIAGTRELVIPGWPYVIVYSIKDEYFLQIERVLHTKRQWPPEDEA